MAGTIAGGKAAAATNYKRHGKDFYKRIGAIGGRASRTGGFASIKLHTCNLLEGEHRIAKCAGMIGGKISRRGKQIKPSILGRIRRSIGV